MVNGNGKDNEEADIPESPELPPTPEFKVTLPPLPKDGNEEQMAQYRGMGIAYSLPMMLVAPIVLLTVGGYWLDGKTGRSPLFTMIGALVGFTAGLINMVRAAGKLK